VTPFGKFVRKVGEKLVGKYYEGPELPDRIRDMVVEFANDHPRATKGDWVDFATALLSETYEAGWLRGYERDARTYDWRPDIAPEVLADMLDPTWREDGRGILLREAGAIVVDEPPTEEDILRRQSEEVFLTGARRRG